MAKPYLVSTQDELHPFLRIAVGGTQTAAKEDRGQHEKKETR
jgi:hypothetical protein